MEVEFVVGGGHGVGVVGAAAGLHAVDVADQWRAWDEVAGAVHVGVGEWHDGVGGGGAVVVVAGGGLADVVGAVDVGWEGCQADVVDA